MLLEVPCTPRVGPGRFRGQQRLGVRLTTLPLAVCSSATAPDLPLPLSRFILLAKELVPG